MLKNKTTNPRVSAALRPDLVKVPLAAGELPEVVAADPPKHSPLRKVWNWLAGR